MTVLDTAYAAIANPVRRQILDQLRVHGTLRAGDIAKRFTAVSRPGISRHLRVLREARLVRLQESADGREQSYALNAEPLAEIEAWLQPYQTFWQGKLGELKEIIENSDR
ncbi:MAG: metalloregulator ArsR/SmtB family transcription factor [Anaerolineae bacterium]|nr:metalloregulator ArsR/SmtB family transcription factor [Anaerolineae bacterium]